MPYHALPTCETRRSDDSYGNHAKLEELVMVMATMRLQGAAATAVVARACTTPDGMHEMVTSHASLQRQKSGVLCTK